ncbi:MAG: hypothetical protein JST38_16615 [Bacteroidetes bacterium]|nr:hypothetical protein [Bacteroidota bacterium]MBS1942493.1 hypothetical protein [Bacteroidota bacterium]
MKKIALNGVRPPMNTSSAYTEHHFYSVHLGNRTTVMFTSERAALAFQAETDRWLSAHLHNANFLLVDAFSSYRAAWCLTDATAVPQADQKAREFIETAWKGMDMAITKGSGPSGWVVAWKWFQQAMESIRLLALLLRDLYRTRNNPVERARMELLASRAQVVLNDMAHYGQAVKGAIKTRQL